MLTCLQCGPNLCHVGFPKVALLPPSGEMMLPVNRAVPPHPLTQFSRAPLTPWTVVVCPTPNSR